jgi:hypothetical protein
MYVDEEKVTFPPEYLYANSYWVEVYPEGIKLVIGDANISKSFIFEGFVNIVRYINLKFRLKLEL